MQKFDDTASKKKMLYWEHIIGKPETGTKEKKYVNSKNRLTALHKSLGAIRTEKR